MSSEVAKLLKSVALAVALLFSASAAKAHTYVICKSGYPVTVVYNRIAGVVYYQVTFIHNNNLSNPKFGSCWWRDWDGSVWTESLMSSSDPYTWRVPMTAFISAVDFGVVSDGQGYINLVGEQSPRVPGSQYDAEGSQGYFFFPPQLTCGGSGDSDYGSIYDHNNNLRYYVYAPTIAGNVISSTYQPFVIWPVP